MTNKINKEAIHSIEKASYAAARQFSKFGRERQEAIRQALEDHWDINRTELENTNVLMREIEWLRADPSFHEAIVFMGYYVRAYEEERNLAENM